MTLELSNKNLNFRIYYSFPSQQQRFRHFDSTFVTVAIPRLLITFGKMEPGLYFPTSSLSASGSITEKADYRQRCRKSIIP